MTGGGGPYGPNIVKASKLAADEINKSGGILSGLMIEIFAEDDEPNATAGVRAARQLLDVDQVNSITGMWGSAPTLAARPIVLEKNVLLGVLGSTDETTQGETKGLVWRFQAKSSTWGEPAARAMIKAGYKNIGVLTLQNPFGTSMIPPFVKTIAAGGGRLSR